MRFLLTLALIGWMALYARPLVRRWLSTESTDAATVFWTTAGIGLGLMTLVAFWGMLVVPGGHAFAWALAVSVLIAAIEFVAGKRYAHGASPQHERDVPTTDDTITRALHVSIVIICASIVFTSVYWPFEVGDALALYAPWAKHLYTTRTLPIGDRVYEGYPMLLPLAYAFTHWAADGINEYLARIVPALMAIGTIAVSGLIGRAVGGPRAGLWAAGLVALTPIFGRWASSGYTDIPAAFYVGLTVLFAWRWWSTGSMRSIVMTGVCAGLAAWTKNSTLTLVPSIAALLLTFPMMNARWPAEARMPSRSIGRAVLLAAAAFLLVAGPWYLRSHLVFGFAVPPTMLIDRVDRTWRALVIMLRPDQSFGLSGIVFTVAPVIGLLALLRRRDRTAAAWYVLLLFLLPFHAAWWWLASYEARFLVAVIPVFAAMGALAIDAWVTTVTSRLAPKTLRVATHVMLAVIVVATAIAWRRTVMHKRVLIERPWPSDIERHQIRLGGLYDLVLALNAMPPGSRVGGVPAIIRYHLADDRLPLISSAPESAPPDQLHERYDAVVYRVTDDQDVPWRTSLTPLLRTKDGYLLYATRPSPATSTTESLP